LPSDCVDGLTKDRYTRERAMGRDLTLYPSAATKNDLKVFLESLGFSRCKHLWDWPKGTLNYSWFDYEDHKSIDGVSADIYPVTEKENKYTNNKWALHVRNLFSASIYDVKMLNLVLRDARKRFGGTIEGDYGTNRYAPVWKDNTTPISRGISGIYENVNQTMRAVEYSLPDDMIHLKENDEKTSKLVEYMKSMDPSRILYNGLVPFLVAMFEYFFSEVFQLLMKYDNYATRKISVHRQKVEFQTVLEMERKERTIEEIIAMNYSFQNLEQLNKAYKEWLDIDIRKILYKKKRIGNAITYLEKRLSEIIQYRHGIVHHLMIDTSLTRRDFLLLIKTVQLGIVEVVKDLERRYSFKVELI
jgi:hypothetical protein